MKDMISIGVITHEPYLGNYKRLMSQIISQKKECEKNYCGNIELVTLLQVSKETFAKRKDIVVGNEKDVTEYVYSKNFTPSEARNFIVNRSAGEWIAFIDGDCEIGINYCKSLINAIKNVPDNIGAIQGGIFASKLSFYGRYEFFYDIISLLEMEIERASIFFKASSKLANKRVKQMYDMYPENNIRKLQGYNFAISRKTFSDIGEFNVSIETAEDREYSARMLKFGKNILFDKEIEVYHDYNMTLKRILRRKKWHAKGCAFLRVTNEEVYDTDIVERFIYMLKMFCICRKPSYIFYRTITDIVFWSEVKRIMKKDYNNKIRFCKKRIQ
jgi:glycosyltransferase involved in cell wall biosynthesis